MSSEKDYFIENLAMLLSSGMSITAALTSIEGEMRTRKMRKAIAGIKQEIDNGSSISTALQKSGLVSPHVISLLKIGEESGRLSENLEVIVVEGEKDRLFKSKIRSAMIYPVMILSVTLVVGIGIAWFILPKLANVFRQLQLELPFVTRVLISFGLFLQDYGVIAIPSAMTILALLMFFLFIFRHTKFIGQSLLFLIPGIKKLLIEVELSRFGYILGTLLAAGLDAYHALDSLKESSELHRYKKFYAFLRDSIEEGQSFEKSFRAYKKSHKLILLPIQQLIVAGEQSGHLSESLIKIGKLFEAKTDITTKNLSVVLEPILLVIVWLGVVAVALAIISPIYSLVGGLN